jgi:hypothetical protein
MANKSLLNFYIYLIIVILYLIYKSHRKKIEIINQISSEKKNRVIVNDIKKVIRVSDSYNLTDDILKNTVDLVF